MQNEILKSIVVQGSALEMDTLEYRKIITSGEGDFRDPFSRVVQLIVRMCEKGEMDPWDVSIKAITKLIQEFISGRLRDFSEAGFLMMSAWHLLYVKSEGLMDSLTHMVIEQHQDDEQQPEYLDNDSGQELYENRHASETTPVEPIVRHERSKILVVEVLEAIKNAYFSRSKLEKLPVRVQLEKDIDSILSEIHPEQPEMEIEKIWQAILKVGQALIRMESIWGDSNLERKKFMIYSTFLGRQKKITLSQEKMGDIWIQRIQDQ